MVFSSPIFLFAFLPIFLILYYLLPYRNLTLLLASLAFYAWGDPVYVLLMLVGILSNYVLALQVEKHHKIVWLMLAIILDLGMLAVFKYADLFISGINTLLRIRLPLANLALPLGISFYTFQMLSYVIDVWRSEIHAERNLLLLGTYICMFPQLIAGPIVRYQDVAPALHVQDIRSDS